MKNTTFVILLLIVLLVACSPPTIPEQTHSSNPTSIPTLQATTQTQSIDSNITEEAQIKDLVGTFGKRLQTVSLLSSDAAQEIRNQYSEFVSPALLDQWIGNISNAPGRTVSSPWPDRIEITTLSKETPEAYLVTGFIVEVTSVEVVNGGAAAKIPVRIVVQKEQGRWLITEYTEGK